MIGTQDKRPVAIGRAVQPGGGGGALEFRCTYRVNVKVLRAFEHIYEEPPEVFDGGGGLTAGSKPTNYRGPYEPVYTAAEQQSPLSRNYIYMYTNANSDVYIYIYTRIRETQSYRDHIIAIAAKITEAVACWS